MLLVSRNFGCHKAIHNYNNYYYLAMPAKNERYIDGWPVRQGNIIVASIIQLTTGGTSCTVVTSEIQGFAEHLHQERKNWEDFHTFNLPRCGWLVWSIFVQLGNQMLSQSSPALQ